MGNLTPKKSCKRQNTEDKLPCMKKIENKVFVDVCFKYSYL